VKHVVNYLNSSLLLKPKNEASVMITKAYFTPPRSLYRSLLILHGELEGTIAAAVSIDFKDGKEVKSNGIDEYTEKS
jgi:hypothetical protein